MGMGTTEYETNANARHWVATPGEFDNDNTATLREAGIAVGFPSPAKIRGNRLTRTSSLTWGVPDGSVVRVIVTARGRQPFGVWHRNTGETYATAAEALARVAAILAG